MKKAVIGLVFALAVPAHAAGEAASEPSKGGRPGTNVEMPFLMAPLADGDGKLVGYAYLSTRLTATSESYALGVREKLPFIQDAMVRDVNAEPIASPDDPENVDLAGVEKRLLSDAVKVMGPGKVQLMTICTLQIAKLHPQQPVTPSRAPPDGAAAKNAAKSRCQA